jgi:hypothetical protein
MLNRKALMLSAGITAFTLIVAGGAFAGYAQSRSAQNADVITAEDVLNDPAVQAVLREREAAYQQMIEEANQRLAELSAPAEEAVASEYPVSAELAAALGRIALGGGTLLRQPALVSVNGRAAYELIYDRGQLYIDATSGAILFNSAALSVLDNRSAGRSHEDDDFDD